MRRLAVIDGGAAAPNVLFSFFFAYSLLLLPLYTFLHPKSPNTNSMFLDLQKEQKQKKKILPPCCLDGGV